MSAAAARNGALIAAVLAAAAAGAGPLVEDEGWRLASYADPAWGAALATNCAGVTRGIEMNQRLTEPECRSRTAQEFIRISFEIAACLPEVLPTEARAAFGRMAYNVGSGAFCKSETARLARAGDLKTACVRMNERPDGKPQWVSANGKIMPGLVKRRASERAQCERGLA